MNMGKPPKFIKILLKYAKIFKKWSSTGHPRWDTMHVLGRTNRLNGKHYYCPNGYLSKTEVAQRGISTESALLQEYSLICKVSSYIFQQW